MTHAAFLLHIGKLLLLPAACLLGGPPCLAQDAQVGGYDFRYLLSGDARAKPVQVFDDGGRTFFQFRPGEPAPAIFVAPGGKPQLVVPVQDGPYLRVPAVHGRFVLQVGRAQALVVHGGGGRVDTSTIDVVAAAGLRQAYAPGAAVPAGARLVTALTPEPKARGDERALDRNSYARPVKGDEVYWPEGSEQEESDIPFARGSAALSRDAQRVVAKAVERAGRSARFTVIGRDDDSYKEGVERARAGALREALLKAGVASDRIKVRTGAMKAAGNDSAWLSTLLVDSRGSPPTMRPAPPRPNSVTAGQPAPAPAQPDVPEGGFTLSTTDRTVSGVVRRWARSLQYQVVWEAPAPLDATIAGEAALPARNLSEALDQLVRGLREKGYALEVTLYANRVIRFTAEVPAPQPTAPADRLRPPVSRTAEAALSARPH